MDLIILLILLRTPKYTLLPVFSGVNTGVRFTIYLRDFQRHLSLVIPMEKQAINFFQNCAQCVRDHAVKSKLSYRHSWNDDTKYGK